MPRLKIEDCNIMKELEDFLDLNVSEQKKLVIMQKFRHAVIAETRKICEKKEKK